MIKKALRFLFVGYVILLAGYVSVKTLSDFRFGRQQAKFIPAKQLCYVGGADWNYCVHTSATSDPQRLLYVFHGKGQDENLWIDGGAYTALVQSRWQQKATKVPTVITLSFGDSWLVTPFMTYAETGLLGRFKTEVFPTIEQRTGTPRQRFLMGASMGGLNVLAIALEMPQNFSRVAALCPPLYELSPHASASDLATFLVQSGAKPRALLSALLMGRRYFANEEEWQRFSPLNTVRSARLSQYQKFYISAGMQDRYGLFEGAHKLQLRLQGAGAQVQWRPTAGDHCSIDATSLADFLSL